MRRDFRGATEGHEAEIVDGDLADIDSCDAVLAAFTAADEGTAMEAWYAHSKAFRSSSTPVAHRAIRGPGTSPRASMRRSRTRSPPCLAESRGHSLAVSPGHPKG